MFDPFMKPEHQQGSPEWLEHRKKFIGASDAAIILGLSPWKTPYQLWEDKMGFSEAQETNYAMQRGHDLEPFARKAFEDYIGIDVFPQIVYHSEHKVLMASLDGLSLDESVAVEIKCPGKASHDIALNGKVPDCYYPQLQHQLACLGIPMINYFSFDGQTGVNIQVSRDDQYIAKMIEKELEFWECVKSGTPPAITDKDYQQMEDPSWFDMARRLASIDSMMKELEAEKKELKAQAIKESGGRSCKGAGMMLIKSHRKGNVDYGTIPELENVNLEPYRKKGTVTWTLRHTKT